MLHVDQKQQKDEQGDNGKKREAKYIKGHQMNIKSGRIEFYVPHAIR